MIKLRLGNDANNKSRQTIRNKQEQTNLNNSDLGIISFINLVNILFNPVCYAFSILVLQNHKFLQVAFRLSRKIWIQKQKYKLETKFFHFVQFILKMYNEDSLERDERWLSYMFGHTRKPPYYIFRQSHWCKNYIKDKSINHLYLWIQTQSKLIRHQIPCSLLLL